MKFQIIHLILVRPETKPPNPKKRNYSFSLISRTKIKMFYFLITNYLHQGHYRCNNMVIAYNFSKLQKSHLCMPTKNINEMKTVYLIISIKHILMILYILNSFWKRKKNTSKIGLHINGSNVMHFLLLIKLIC